MPSVILQTSFLGDLVLTTPLIRAVARRDGAPATVVCTPASAPLLAGNPDVGRVVTYDKRRADRGVAGLRRVAAALRGHAVAYCVQGSWRTALLPRLAGIPAVVGMSTSQGRLLYTRRVPTPVDGTHAAHKIWRLAQGDPRAVPTDDDLRPRLHPGPAERAAVDALLTGAGWDAGPFIALAPGSNWRTKRWPGFDALAARLGARRVAVVGGADDAPLAAALAAARPAHPTLDACGRLSLLASAELIRRADALVTNDSSPLHLASAMGTPTVAVFGPTVLTFGFGPLAPRRAVVEHPGPLDCRPCDAHGPRTCPLGHWRCMREVSVDAVATALAAVESAA
jgi:heptosyltransferase-2